MTEVLRHGGDLDAMRRMFPNAPEPWVDLSTGINPWPWPMPEITSTLWERLPTQKAFQDLKAAMAGAFGADPAHVLPIPGSELAIHLLPTVLSPRRVAVLEPTYGDHARVWQAAGCEVIETDDPLSFSDQVDAVVLCNPNNPNGRRFDPSDLEISGAKLAQRGGVLIIDEAYADLCPNLSMARHTGKDGLLVLRSMGKFYGLAGLRLGAVLGPESLLEKLGARLGVWILSGLALVAGCDAYQDSAWQKETREKLKRARKALDEQLSEAGCEILGGTELFAFVRVPSAMETWTRLAEAGVSVRRFEWSDTELRIGLPATDEQRDKLTAALIL